MSGFLVSGQPILEICDGSEVQQGIRQRFKTLKVERFDPPLQILTQQAETASELPHHETASLLRLALG